MKLLEAKATASPAHSKLMRVIEQRGVTPAQLAALVDQIQNPPPLAHNTHKHSHGRKRIKFGLCSDTHIGSKYADYSALNDIYKRFEIEEVQAVYHAGDLTEGYERRKGHTYECDLHGFDDQVKGVVERYPCIKGVTTYFITGDHDGWHKDAGGASIGPNVAEKRRDMVFLGECAATVEFTPQCRIMLSHPAKGTSYAISYQVQKQIEALAGGTKPQLLAVGHYHKAEYFFYRNIHAFQTGCLQRQTGWMKRMGLSAHMGGWIVEIWLNSEGKIDRLRQELIPYYE